MAGLGVEKGSIVININRNQRLPQRQPIEDSRSPCTSGNYPANLAELGVLRRRSSMPLIAADGRPMAENTFGGILEQVFLGV